MRWGGRKVSLPLENSSRPTSCPYRFPSLLRSYLDEIKKQQNRGNHRPTINRTGRTFSKERGAKPRVYSNERHDSRVAESTVPFPFCAERSPLCAVYKIGAFFRVPGTRTSDKGNPKMPIECRIFDSYADGAPPNKTRPLFRIEEHSTTLDFMRATVIWLGSVMGWNALTLRPLLASAPLVAGS